MLRPVRPSVFTGLFLIVCTVWICAETAKAQVGAANSKRMYSNRPVDYATPTPYYGTPMAPRFTSPPATPPRIYAPHVNTIGMDAAAPVVVPIIAPHLGDMPPPWQVGGDMNMVPLGSLPGANVNDELDAFYARLAKIRLEKHQLADTLALVDSIKSETFKVRTLVSLAEYVARDKNYQSEAEQLFRLAIDGIEALNKNRPVRIYPEESPAAVPPVIAIPDRYPIPDPPSPPPAAAEQGTQPPSATLDGARESSIPPLTAEQGQDEARESSPPPASPRTQRSPILIDDSDDPPSPPPAAEQGIQPRPPLLDAPSSNGSVNGTVQPPGATVRNGNGNGRQPPPPPPLSPSRENGVGGTMPPSQGNGLAAPREPVVDTVPFVRPEPTIDLSGGDDPDPTVVPRPAGTSQTAPARRVAPRQVIVLPD